MKKTMKFEVRSWKFESKRARLRPIATIVDEVWEKSELVSGLFCESVLAFERRDELLESLDGFRYEKSIGSFRYVKSLAASATIVVFGK